MAATAALLPLPGRTQRKDLPSTAAAAPPSVARSPSSSTSTHLLSSLPSGMSPPGGEDDEAEQRPATSCRCGSSPGTAAATSPSTRRPPPLRRLHGPPLPGYLPALPRALPLLPVPLPPRCRPHPRCRRPRRGRNPPEGADRRHPRRKLQRLLMLSSHRRLLLSKLAHLAGDLGLPPDFRSGLCNRHPDRFRTVDTSYGRALELAAWDSSLAASLPPSPPAFSGDDPRRPIIDRPPKFKHLKLRRGLNLKRRHREYLIRFQELPEVSPFCSYSELVAASPELAERRACAVVREREAGGARPRGEDDAAEEEEQHRSVRFRGRGRLEEFAAGEQDSGEEASSWEENMEFWKPYAGDDLGDQRVW
ncbi:unnamed protein product [Spirodela intermedia]|uniref:PORR domain-containing protein n=1 Tax=Spirodela intermedia TaxID=51605 RepID=A0A7I8IPC5_SPIIN|nr:unnamed protein product [Spirodela intermedia]CAA6659816.1 unnamed protein product [Spirodela intermedia]